MKADFLKESLMKTILAPATFAIFFTLVLGACSKQTSSPALVTKVETEAQGPAPEAGLLLSEKKNELARAAGLEKIDTEAFVTPSDSSPVVSKVTINKAAIFNKQLFYSTDLQYSSIGEVSLSLIRQSETGGLTLVYFRIADNVLQLLADQRHVFESDINHPERLIQQFPILAQTNDTLTIQVSQASPVLNTAIAGAKAAPVRTSWVRSVKYVADAQILMFESSIELADGSIAEFMESIFPREAVVPSDAKAIYNDPELEPSAARYRFLDTGEIFVDMTGKGRVKTKVASRFLVTPGKTIDWYVTPNVPDEYFETIKLAVLGWNRYSQKMWGKNFLDFKGKLPAGIKLGDPRFNVINWDSVAEAGAAYESQATDPLTGITSHSLIYLPKAWVNIGRKYWEQGVMSEGSAFKSKRLRDSIQNSNFLGRKLPVTCLQGLEDAEGQISLESRVDPDTFAKELLKGTLFHEVGHALGLAHNFKASLSYDPKDEKTPFSTSIMDYNQYQIEKAAFAGVSSAEGPLLEYDRQVLSVLYNSGKDVSTADPKILACEDSEADSLDEGVDPLCIRYDAGRDPSVQLALTILLIKEESAADRAQRSLGTALKAISNELGDSSSFKAKDTTAKQLAKIAKFIKGTVAYYYVGGHVGVMDMARVDARLLRKYKEDSLPTGYEEREMRLRAMEGIRYAATTEALEPGVKLSLAKLNSLVQAWLLTTNYIASLGPEKQAEEVKTLMAGLNELPTALENAVLSKMRTKVLGTLGASEKAPYYYAVTGSQTVDFEHDIAQMLARNVTSAKLDSGEIRPVDERISAAKSLKTFAGTVTGASFVTDAANTLKNEARAARDLQGRTDAMNILRALTAPAEKAEK